MLQIMPIMLKLCSLCSNYANYAQIMPIMLNYAFDAKLCNYAKLCSPARAGWGRRKWSSPKPPGRSSSLAQYLEAKKNAQTSRARFELTPILRSSIDLPMDQATRS